MRSAVSAVCGLVAAVLLPVALVSVWLHTVVADSGEYLARVVPLAAEEQVRNAVEDVLVDQLQDQLGPLLDRAGSGAAGGTEELVRRVVATVVGSDAFVTLWSTAQRAVHREVVAVLDSPRPPDVGARVVIPLDAVVDAVRDQLAGLGLQLPGVVDGLSVSVPMTTAADLEAARTPYRVLVHFWLLFPVAAGVLAIGCLLLARRRLRALALLGLLAALACLGLLLVTGAGRQLVLGTTPSGSARFLTGRITAVLAADLRRAAVAGVLLGAVVVVLAGLLGLLAKGGHAVRRTVGG